MPLERCRSPIRCESHSAFNNKRFITSQDRQRQPFCRSCTSIYFENSFSPTLAHRPASSMSDTVMNDAIKNDVGPSAAADNSGAGPAPAPAPTKTLKSQILGGTLTLLAGSGLVGIKNLVSNVVTARLLGPVGFAHATAVYTILMLMSCITLAFQVVSAKYIARSPLAEDRVSVFVSLHRRAWIAGIIIGSLLFLFAGPLTTYLNLPDPVLISLLPPGIAFYIPLGVRRGYIQGVHAFRPLAVNFMLEGLVRLGGLCPLKIGRASRRE